MVAVQYLWYFGCDIEQRCSQDISQWRRDMELIADILPNTISLQQIFLWGFLLFGFLLLLVVANETRS